MEDLKELGISASGTARMLLVAIAQLCADANTEIAAATSPRPRQGRSGDFGEVFFNFMLDGQTSLLRCDKATSRTLV